MGNKVPPLATRLSLTNEYKGKWFFSKNFRVFLEADYWIRKIAKEFFWRKGLIDIIIERKSSDNCKIILMAAKPGLIVGKEGQNLNKFQSLVNDKMKEIFTKHKLKTPRTEIDVQEVKKPFTSAQYLADLAAQDIEKNKLARQVMKKVIEKARQHKEIEGVKIKLSGRLNGATIHRSEWLAWGRMPTTTLGADIDYGESCAYMKYGVIGVKVWLYKGEKLNS